MFFFFATLSLSANDSVGIPEEWNADVCRFQKRLDRAKRSLDKAFLLFQSDDEAKIIFSLLRLEEAKVALESVRPEMDYIMIPNELRVVFCRTCQRERKLLQKVTEKIQKVSPF